MGQADYLRLGDWNIRCDRCGKKIKGTEARQTWNNLYVCGPCWEPRHPQDFVRSVVEHPTPPFVRDPPDTLIERGEAIILEDSTDTSFFDPGADVDYVLLEAATWFIVED